MDPLIDELTRSGVLTDAMLGWARAHQAERGLAFDRALLELDLIDEEGLLQGLEACYGMSAVKPGDLGSAEPGLAKSLPEGFSRSFHMCPLRLEGGELVALVEAPLPQESLADLEDLFGLKPRQLLATSHLIRIAQSRVYETPLDPDSAALEVRLERRRTAGDLQGVLTDLSQVTTLVGSLGVVLDYAEHLLDYACFLGIRRGELRVLSARGRGGEPKRGRKLPGPDCLLGAAVQYGGYFLGPVQGTAGDRQFYAELGRDQPRWAVVAPVPTSGESRLVFYGDNGARGIATRWVARLLLLSSRLGQRPEAPRRGDSSALNDDDFELFGAPPGTRQVLSELHPEAPAAPHAAALPPLPIATSNSAMPAPAASPAAQAVPPQATPPPAAPLPTAEETLPPPPQVLPPQATPPPAAPPPAAPLPTAEETSPPPPQAVPPPAALPPPAEETSLPPPHDGLTDDERSALERLRTAAQAAGVSVLALVEQLLAPVPKPAAEATALVGEVKDLFQRLATDIPAQLARGMETAFREIMPRIAVPAPSPPPSAACSADPTPAAAKVGLVKKEAGPREVESYQAKRQKTKRIKL